MIVQCQACQTRFRLADEKVKPGGTKVRCSKCKEIFTVSPPEPEPVEEAVDFGSFNMEAVSDETQEETSEPSVETEEQETETSAAPESETAEEDSAKGVDFSGLETEMSTDDGIGEELADDFSFADTEQPAEEDTIEEDTFSASDLEGTDHTAEEEQPEIGAAFEETEEPGAMEFDFSEEPDTEKEAPLEASSEEEASKEQDTEFSFEDNEGSTEGPGEFSFEEEPGEPAQEETGDFSFGEDEDDAYSFQEESDSPTETTDDGEFSFDDESPFGTEDSSEWDDDSSEESDSFDFEEPQFDNEADSSAAVTEKAAGDEGGLQFGEIDFASDSEEDAPPGGVIDEDFANATMETQPEAEPFASQEQAPSAPSRDYDEEEPLLAPPKPKKSSLSRILLLLVLLLVVLGGGAAFMVMQGGSANLNMVTEYLPFLKDYIGEAQEASPADSIDINISGSSYVNNSQVGQMLVIQGSAVNKHPASRSSITIKGVLLDSQGKTLLQQTVFCGNRLAEKQLASLPFKQIEEAMNNEFGDGLSNMNIATGASIPFTIVFRNLPDGIANINVEVVDSKPGAN